MKTTKLWLTTIAMLWCSLTASAHDFEVAGIYYDITSSANLTVGVTYRGSSAYDYSNEYREAVTIPSTVTYNSKTYRVTSIGNSAFRGCSSLTAITIPEGVTSIGIGAFYGCSSLTSITIPEGVTSIGDEAFADCSSLTAITIPEGVTSIGNSAFEGTAWYNSLPDGLVYIGKVLYKYKGTMPENTSIEVKEGIVSISPQAFRDCSSLTSITLPESVTSIGYYAFADCSSLTAITIPEGVTSIGMEAFRDCSSLTSITIPEGVTSIGNSAFEGTAWYNSLPDGLVYIGKVLYKYKGTMPENTSIEVKEGIVSISSQAFADCSSLTSITLPESVTSIGEFAFADCSSLTAISIPESVTSIGDRAFCDCSSLTSITLPESVTSIGKSAFERCSSLTAISIPESVTSIGDWAFCSCSSLTSITVDEGNSVYDSRNGCNAIIETSSNSLIQGCTSTVIPEGVTSIGMEAFRDCSSLTSITIPEGVTSIGSSAFRGCSSLTAITIPESVTSIGDYAFFGCSSLKTVINYSDLDVANYAEEVIKPTKVGDYGFATIDNVHYLLGYTGNETELILPDDYQGENYQIRKDAFRGCRSLTSIIIPEGVTSIGEEAFYGCENLKMVINNSDLTLQKGDSGNGYVAYYADKVVNVDCIVDGYCFKTRDGVHCLIDYLGDDTALVLPEDCQGDDYVIAESVFQGNEEIVSVKIPQTVGTIGNGAFADCANLASVEMARGVMSIGSHAFYNCSSLTAVHISSIEAWCYIDFEDSYANPLYYAKNLYINGELVTELVIPNSVTAVKDYAFRSCTSLTTITLPKSLTSIGNSAFSGCSSLTAVHISSIEAWCYIDFEDSYANPLYYAKNLYINGELVTELVIPNSVTAVKDYAFRSYTSLTTITIPESVTSIGNSAFEGCSSLTAITIPEGVRGIGSSAFYGCSSLKTVINYSDLYIRKGSSSNGYVAYYADKVVNVDCIVDGYCFKTRDGVHCLIDYLGDDTALVLPEDYQGDDYVIAESVFQGNVDIVSVKIPQTIGTIGNSAFADCANLASIEMARGVMSIGDKAFENCTSLASVTIPQNMRSIGHGAFKGCSSLASVEFKEGVETFGDNAFEGCAALTEIMLPKSLTAVGANAFKGCSGLISVIVDKNVETFGTGAFEGCTVVKTLVVKGSVMPTVPSSALTLIVLYSPHPLAAEEFANKVYRDATLYVPTGSIARYQAADVWKNFWTIKEFDSTQEMSLSLDQTAATLTEDESLTLTASITPEFMADMTVTWSTSDAAVATVDEHGVVTALAAGTTTITATAGDYSATCVVTVTKKEGEVVGIENSEIRNHESEIIFDLSGRRVEKMEKGIYIVGGKKVVIK